MELNLTGEYVCLVLTCDREYYRTRRENNINTFELIQQCGFKVIFLVADPRLTEPKYENYHSFVKMTLPMVDRYDFLTPKMKMAYGILFEKQCAGVLKIDDDISIGEPDKLSALLSLMKEHDYSGLKLITMNPGIHELRSTRFIEPHYRTMQVRINKAINYFGGPFYYVSKNALAEISRRTFNFIFEDVAVAELLSNVASIRTSRINNIAMIKWDSATEHDMSEPIILSPSVLPNVKTSRQSQKQSQKQIQHQNRMTRIKISPRLRNASAPAQVPAKVKLSQTRKTKQSEICYAEVIGGLGNQLFIIATAFAHAKKNGLRLSLGSVKQNSRPNYFDKFFTGFKHCLNSPSTLSTRFRWKEPHFHFVQIPPAYRWLSGYFQSSKYFKTYEDELRQLLEPPDSVKNTVIQKYTELLEHRDEFTIVHVRRGDYFNPNNAEIHGTLTADYYVNAMKIMDNTKFLIFSDDIEWCKNNLQQSSSEIRFIDEPDECVSLWLMAQFPRFIMSNSTFSWWAVFMGPQPKKVIAPSKWFGPKGPQDWHDIYESTWQLI